MDEKNPYSLFSSPGFLPALFFELVHASPRCAWLHGYDLKKEAELSYGFDLSSLQDSYRFRTLNRARALAHILIDDRSELDKNVLERTISTLRSQGYLFYPEGYSDSAFTEETLQFLTRLLREDSLIKSIKRFRKPLCHKWAERLVLDTLGLYGLAELSNAHIQRAVLCACLTPLRQNVGSCFATAPAILIQREQPELFLEDLYQLLSTGRLKRVFGGIEYSTPLASSTGVGDLRKNLISLSNQAMLHTSPGLIAVCEAEGLISSHLPFETKTRLLQEILTPFMQGKESLTVEEWIHHLLLKKMHMEEEDLAKARRIQRIRTGQLFFVSDRIPSQKVDQLEQFQDKEQQLRSIFKYICDNALLKAWEFTLASFVDVKTEFSRWNLYISLGFSPEEPEGIGKIAFDTIDTKLQSINKQVQELQLDYQLAYDQVRATEILLRNASSETESRRLRAEHHSRTYHMQSCLEARNRIHSQGTLYASLFNILLKAYSTLFPDYFQEIYDPDMQEAERGAYEDGAAGFRLVYKHGRTDPAQWTLIYDARQYVDALVDFFSITETQVAAYVERQEATSEIAEITSTIISHLHTESFLSSAFERIERASRSSQQTKTPWAYLSGGTMTTLLQAYFCREQELFIEEKRIEQDSDLLIFLIDTMKGVPPSIVQDYVRHPAKGMLMTSPTHAFLFLPGFQKIREGWQESGFTYTWVRDEIYLPSQRFYAAIRLDAPSQLFLLEELCRVLPSSLSSILLHHFPSQEGFLSVAAWRQAIFSRLPVPHDNLKDIVDAFLYRSLPLVDASKRNALVKQLLSDLYEESIETILHHLPSPITRYMTAGQIKELAQGCVLQAKKTLNLQFDLHAFIAKHARFIGLSAPTSLLFADSNWTSQYFGFVVNPGTGQLELWRVDRALFQGWPMSAWSRKQKTTPFIPWTLYTHPFEYQGGPQQRPFLI